MRSSVTKKLIFVAIILTLLVYFTQMFEVTNTQIKSDPAGKENVSPHERVEPPNPAEDLPPEDDSQSTAKSEESTFVDMSMEEELNMLQSSETPFAAKMNSISSARNGRVRKICRESGLAGDFMDLPPETQQSYSNILVSDKHKAVLCSTGDVNGESVKKLLEDPGATEESVKADLRLLTSYRPESVSYRLKYYYKFMIVQEPMVRLHSVYKSWLLPHSANLQKGSENQTSHSSKELHDLSQKMRLTFDPESFYNREPNATKFARVSDFASHVINQTSAGKSLHPLWERYHDLCLPCMIKYDHVMRSETAADDAKFVFSRLKDAVLKDYPVAHVESSDLESIKELRGGLTDELAAAIYLVYSRDFEMFGYPKPWM